MTKEVYEQALQHEKELYKASVKLGTHVKSVARDVRQHYSATTLVLLSVTHFGTRHQQGFLSSTCRIVCRVFLS